MQPEGTYWHFLGADRRLSHGDGREVRPGETLRVKGRPRAGRHGLHASPRALDALRYAPGPVACLVTLGCLALYAVLALAVQPHLHPRGPSAVPGPPPRPSSPAPPGVPGAPGRP